MKPDPGMETKMTGLRLRRGWAERDLNAAPGKAACGRKQTEKVQGNYVPASRRPTLTPGWQFTTFDLPAYAEQAITGANTFALACAAKDRPKAVSAWRA